MLVLPPTSSRILQLQHAMPSSSNHTITSNVLREVIELRRFWKGCRPRYRCGAVPTPLKPHLHTKYIRLTSSFCNKYISAPSNKNTRGTHEVCLCCPNNDIPAVFNPSAAVGAACWVVLVNIPAVGCCGCVLPNIVCCYSCALLDELPACCPAVVVTSGFPNKDVPGVLCGCCWTGCPNIDVVGCSCCCYCCVGCPNNEVDADSCCCCVCPKEPPPNKAKSSVSRLLRLCLGLHPEAAEACRCTHPGRGLCTPKERSCRLWRAGLPKDRYAGVSSRRWY